MRREEKSWGKRELPSASIGGAGRVSCAGARDPAAATGWGQTDTQASWK